MGYSYQGIGYLFPIADVFDSQEKFIDALNDYEGEEYSSLEEVENYISFADYEGPDNIEYATISGREIDTSIGILVSIIGTTAVDVEGMFCWLMERGVDPNEYYGDVEVCCLQ